MPLQTGKKAPSFSLLNGNGKTVALSDLHGTWVILYFYPKDNTSGCTREAIDFTGILPDLKKQHATVIGISPDSTDSHAKFIRKHALRVELLSDPDHKVCSRYGVWQKKKLYGKEYFGVVRTTVLIDPDGIVRHIWEKVKVAGHAEAVTDTLKICRSDS